MSIQEKTVQKITDDTIGDMNLAQKLVQLRKERDMSQDDVGRALGVDQRNVSGWESGKNKPSLDTAAKLAKLFGVSIDYLVFESVPREGFEAINDFDLYEKFRETEKLETEDKKFVSHLIDLILMKVKFRDIIESDPSKSKQAESPPLRKVAGKR